MPDAGSDFEYHSDPRLPRNVMLVMSDDHDTVWALETGIRAEGGKGVTVTDMEPDAEDDTVTHLEYVFVEHGGSYHHVHTTLHRHDEETHDPDGGEGECEQTPPEDNPAPRAVTDIVVDALRVPVTTASDGDHDGGELT